MIKTLRRIILEKIPCQRPPERQLDLDAARGFAIILVVIGHIATTNFSAGNGWYLSFVNLIYQFHMPLFMVLTGITFALSLPCFNSWPEVLAYSTRRVKRLLVPYLVIGLLVLIGKLVACHFMHVDNAPGSFTEGVIGLVRNPTESAAKFLWFVFVLSIYLVFVPAFFFVIGRRPWLLLIIGVILQLGTWPNTFAISWIIYYLPFFAGGAVLWIYRSMWCPMPLWALGLNVLVFGSLLLASISLSIPKWLVGASSVLAVIGLMQKAPTSFQSALAWLGKYSLSIYLFNEIAMGVVKGALLKVISWDGSNFLFFLPLMALVGVVIPLLLKYLATKFSPRVATYF
jgi:fucose 4-O-acetylase-like acetyltransferase